MIRVWIDVLEHVGEVRMRDVNMLAVDFGAVPLWFAEKVDQRLWRGVDVFGRSNDGLIAVAARVERAGAYDKPTAFEINAFVFLQVTLQRETFVDLEIQVF